MTYMELFSGAGARLARAAIVCAPLVLLGACGGGGDDAAPAAPPDNPIDGGSLVITSANARAVAADALDNATNLETAAAGSDFLTGVQVDVGGGGAATLRLVAAARALAGMLPAGGASATGVAFSEVMQCSGGGTLSVSGNVANENTLSPGDNAVLVATSCVEVVEGDSVTMNGRMQITVTAGGFDPDAASFPRRIAIAMVVTDFAIASGGETLATNGDLAIDLTETSSTAGSAVVSGTSLASSVTRSSGSRSFALRNYRQAVTFAGDGETMEVTASIESTNARLGSGVQSYAVSTPALLRMNGSGDFTGGSLRVAGSGSALLLTVTATNTFRIEVDSNGDGTVDATSTATLSELRALL